MSDESNLREMKPAARTWVVGGVDSAKDLREAVERALAEGERVILVWSMPTADGGVTYVDVHYHRQGCRMSWTEFCGALQAMLHKYWRDMVDSL